MPFSAGDVLAERFHLERQIGEGSRAVAFQANDHVTDRRVVCKIPRDRSNDCMESIRSQHDIMRRMRSFRLPLLHDLWMHGTEAEALPFLVMEYVEGETGNDWYLGKDDRSKLELFAGIAEAVADLNEAGIAHGDVDLGNVRRLPSGDVVLIDPDPGNYASAVARRLPFEGSISDLRGLRGIGERLFEDAPFARGLLARLGQDEIAIPTAREVAGAVRAMLADSLLPGDLRRPFSAVATKYVATIANDNDIFKRICQLRDLAFHNLIDQLGEMSASCRMEVEPTNHDLHDLEAELASLGFPKGTFRSRSLRVRAAHGDDHLLLTFSSHEFRKPWPEDEHTGLLGRGEVAVLQEGDSLGTVRYPLEIWLEGGAPMVRLIDCGRRLPFDDAAKHRLFRILAEDTYPGLRAGRVYNLEGSLNLGSVSKYQKALDHLGIGMPGPSPVARARALCHVALALPCDSVLGNGYVGSTFNQFFDLPRSKRPMGARHGTSAFVAAVGHLFKRIDRVDITNPPCANVG